MNGKKFTKAEEKLLKNMALSHTQVARLTGRNVASIFTKRKAMGLIDKCHCKRTKWKAEELDLLIEPKLSISDIAKKLGRTYASVNCMYRFLNDHV